MLIEYFDVFWGMGSSKFEFVLGIDCLSMVIFFDIIYFVSSSELVIYWKLVCLFEFDFGFLLCRYFDNDFEGGYNFYGGMLGNVLVLCFVFIVYNYDYIYDYLFYFNGVVEVRVLMSGYV